MERLQDMFKKNYDEYLTSPENTKNVEYLIHVSKKIIYTL